MALESVIESIGDINWMPIAPFLLFNWLHLLALPFFHRNFWYVYPMAPLVCAVESNVTIEIKTIGANGSIDIDK